MERGAQIYRFQKQKQKLHLFVASVLFKLKRAAMKSASPWIPSSAPIYGPHKRCPALLNRVGKYCCVNGAPHGSQEG